MEPHLASIYIESLKRNNEFRPALVAGLFNQNSKAMRILIIFCLLLIASHSVATRGQQPDLSKKEDLMALGLGRIIEKDRSIRKSITLYVVKEYWVVYVKNGSVHDLLMEKIDRIEFSDSKWGRIKLEFPEGKAKISPMLN